MQLEHSLYPQFFTPCWLKRRIANSTLHLPCYDGRHRLLGAWPEHTLLSRPVLVHELYGNT